MSKRKTFLSLTIVTMLLTAAFVTLPLMVSAGFPFTAFGYVDANSVTGVRAYDAVQNGETAFYIQNWRSNGTSENITKFNPGNTTDFFDWNAGGAINWNPENEINGDPSVVIVSREEGTWALDREGYVASTIKPFDTTNYVFPTCELLKIPVPVEVQTGVDYAEVSWPDINDPFGLIAGYTLYRSTTNGSLLGEADWTLVTGVDKDNPITGPSPSFNDTGLALGTYYYALKVCFVGYNSDNPSNVNNFESKFMGEGSASIEVTLGPPTVDYINITSSPGGPAYTTKFVAIAGFFTAYASGYNNTGPTYVGLVEVDWSGPGGSWLPTKGTSSVFTAGVTPGTYTQTGENLSMPVTDTFDVEIFNPTVDYIVITNAPDGNELITVDTGVGMTYTAYASGYNNTGPTYVGLVEVGWSGLGGAWLPLLGTSSVYTAGLTPGVYTQTGQNASLIDTFDFNILPPTVDYIKITDSPDGTALTTETLPIGGTVTAYASGYNITGGDIYVGLVTVDWLNNGGSWGPSTGNSSTFTAGVVGGLFNQVAQNLSLGVSDDFDIDILPPTLDDIIITDGPDGNPLTTETLIINPPGSLTAYASGYNNTLATYVGLVEVQWTGTGGGTWNPLTGTSSTFTAGALGLFTQTAFNVSAGVSDDFDVYIIDLTIDYITLTETPNGTVLVTKTIPIGGTVLAYASAYNNTGPTYLGLLEVNWINNGGTWSPGLGKSSTFTAGYAGGFFNQVAQNLTAGVSDDFNIDILFPTVDYIIITDLPNGTALTTVTLPIGGTVTAYASGYNNTGNTYAGLVSVSWSNNGGSWSPGTGSSSTFTAGYAGGLFNQVATGTGVSDNFNIDIIPPTLDYIILTATPNGTPLGTVNIPIGGTVTAYASGYNSTGPTYVGLVSVDWTNSGGSWAPSTGNTSTFTAGFTAGLFNQVAQNTGLGVSDDFDINILTPTVDYIILTATPNGTPLGTEALPIGGTLIAYASGYNNTGSTYVGLVSVTWTNNGGSWAPTTGNTSTFTAGLTSGLFNQVATGTGVSDDFDIDILPPTVNYIVLTATPDGTPLATETLPVGGMLTAFASGYNNTGPTYVGLVSVTWTDNGGSWAPSTGNTSTFTGGLIAGLFNQVATGTGVSDDFDIDILPPTPNEIRIRDAANNAGNVVTTANFNVGDSDIFYAAGYNTTSGYIGDIRVTWTVTPTSGVGTVGGAANSTTFNAVGAGNCTVTATNSTYSVSNSTGVLTVLAVVQEVTSIKIMDAPGGVGNEVDDMTYSVYQTDFFYCAAFSGATYLYDVVATWETSDALVGDIQVTPPPTFSAQLVSADGTCVITATYNNGTADLTDDTGTLTVLAPKPDYIQIQNAPGGAGTIVTTRTFGVGATDEFYASAHNNTVGYLYDVSVSWTSSAIAVGTVTTPGNYTTFTAQKVATQSTCTVTATHTGTSLTNQTGLITVLVPTVDEIKIHDAADGAGNVVGDMTYDYDDTDVFYAAGYNKTSGYVMDVDATWSSSNTAVGQVTASGTSTTFLPQTLTASGTCIVTATYSGISNVTGTLTVNAAPDTTPPTKPGTPEKGKVTADSVKFTWPANTESDLKNYIIQRSNKADGPWENISTVDKSQTSYTDEDVKQDTTYYYRVIAVDEANNPSTPSDWMKVTTEPEEGIPWLWLILIIIIIVIVLIIFLATRKKKEEPAPMPEQPVAMPVQEAPAEEMVPEEEYVEEEYEEEGAEPEGEYEEEVEYEEEPGEEYEEEEEVEYEEEEPDSDTPPPPPPPPPPA